MRKSRVQNLARIACFATLTTVFAAGAVLYAVEQDVPNIQTIEDYIPIQGTRIYSDDGYLIGHIATEKRVVVPIAAIPKHVRQAFLAAEDAGFYQHEGLDYFGILRAAIKNLRPGAHLQGASTITQQTVKTLLVGSERSYMRKLREAVLARKLEQLLSKDDILYIYLNQIYFGAGAYGCEQAAQTYFGKSVAELDLGEAAYLAAIPKNPSRYTIIRNPKAAKKRQGYVLGQMRDLGWADAKTVERELSKPPPKPAPPKRYLNNLPSFTEHVRRTLLDTLGKESVYGSGYTVYTSVHAGMQEAAQNALRQGLENIARRHGFRGAKIRIEVDRFGRYYVGLRNHFDSLAEIRGFKANHTLWDLGKISEKTLADPEAVTHAMRTTALQVGARTTALVTGTNSQTKQILVDLGGREGHINLADIAWARHFSPLTKTPEPTDPSEVVRQGDLIEVEVKTIPKNAAGSTTSIELDLVPVIGVNGALVAINPHTRFVQALVGGYEQQATGFNRATQALRQPGSAFKPIAYAAGLKSHTITPASTCADSPVVIHDRWTGKPWKPENYEDGKYDGLITYRTALMRSKNTCSVKMAEKMGPKPIIEMARAMGITSKLPNNLTIALGTGDVTPAELTNAYATIASGGLFAKPIFIRKITDHSSKVILDHKPTPERVLSESLSFILTHMLQSVVESGTGMRAKQLGRPLAGKTGTTNQSRNAWFAGFAPSLVATVWTGFDDNAPMGRLTGSSAALPIWIDFMKEALAKHPKSPFAVPEDVILAQVDPKTGEPSEEIGSIEEVFLPGTEPAQQTKELPSLFIEDIEN